MGNLLPYIQTSGSYTPNEAVISPSNQASQKAFANQNVIDKLTSADKSTIDDLLNQVLVLARKNRNDIDTMVSNLQTSENELKQAVDSFQNNDIMNQLSNTKVNRTIFNIANIQYTEYYTFMNEYKYRLSIVSYKKQVLKSQLKDLDSKIQTLQNYMATL